MNGYILFEYYLLRTKLYIHGAIVDPVRATVAMEKAMHQ